MFFYLQQQFSTGSPQKFSKTICVQTTLIFNIEQNRPLWPLCAVLPLKDHRLSFAGN